jgi:sarcosine oxidase, subunit beta
VEPVVVVGAGIVGCSTAYYLGLAGVAAVVIDAGGVGGQASTQTAGNLHFQLSYRAMKGTREEFLHHTRVLPWNLDADARWHELSAASGGRIAFQQQGGVVVAESEADAHALREKARAEQAAGFATEYLDRDALAAQVPEVSAVAVGASWHAREGFVNARTAVYELARLASGGGARFRLGVAVRSIARIRGGWRLSLSDGDSMDTEEVVIAAGAWTARVAALAGAAVPVVSSALTMSVTAQAPRPLMSRLVMHASRPLSIKQFSSGNVMIGGGRPARLLNLDDDVSLLRMAPDFGSVLAGIEDAGRVIPATVGLPVIRSWQGLLATPVDELPIVGRLPSAPGITVSVGGHTGYTLGPTGGRVAADVVLGVDSAFDVAEFGPARFGRAA